MKIGIIGGTFNPIHNGHLSIAKSALQSYSLDEIWFLPNGNPPHKNKEGMQTSIEERIQMIELAISKEKGFRLERYEADREEISPTADTLEYFSKTYPNHQFYFILGGDSIFALESWIRPKDIFRQSILIAVYRKSNNNQKAFEEKIKYYHEKYQATIQILEADIPDISSTEIRSKSAMGESLCGMVPKKVEAYIQKHHLYQ